MRLRTENMKSEDAVDDLAVADEGDDAELAAQGTSGSATIRKPRLGPSSGGSWV